MAFPAPPDFYKRFTPENVARHRANRAAATPEQKQNGDAERMRRAGAARPVNGEAGSAPRSPLPEATGSSDRAGFGYAGPGPTPVVMEGVEESGEPAEDLADDGGDSAAGDEVDDDGELLYLDPPPPLTTGSYLMFGRSWPVLEQHVLEQHPSLQDVGETQLYPDGCDCVHELKCLNRSLLFNFVELLRSMTETPDEISEHMEHLRQLFVNMHHLINEYRPHQAREDLRRLMQDQLERKRAENTAIRRACEQVMEILAPPMKAAGETT